MLTDKQLHQRSLAGQASAQAQRDALGDERYRQRQSDKGSRGGRPTFHEGVQKAMARNLAAKALSRRGRKRKEGAGCCAPAGAD